MVISVHAGHGASNSKSCGAVGVINESDEARKVKNEVIRLLKQEGHIVYDTTVDYPLSAKDCLNKIVTNCNKYTTDLDVSIHFNSGANDKNGNGATTGTEVFVYSSTSKAKSYADRVVNKIASLGFKNRGVKYSTALAVLKTKNPCMLIECCFVDDKDDVKLYNYQTMAKAIVEGILGKSLSNTTTTTDKVVENNNKTKVKVDGKVYEFEAIVQNGTTYVKLRDFAQAGYKIDYVDNIATIDKP